MLGQPPDQRAEPVPTSELEDRLAKIWKRSRPAVLERLALLEGLAAAVEPDEATMSEGRTEAHKLAGLLGTLGIRGGSELAKTVELELASGRTDGLDRPLAELRTLVETA